MFTLAQLPTPQRTGTRAWEPAAFAHDSFNPQVQVSLGPHGGTGDTHRKLGVLKKAYSEKTRERKYILPTPQHTTLQFGATGPHSATSGQCEPRGILQAGCQNLGSGQGCPNFRAAGGVLCCSSRAEYALCPGHRAWLSGLGTYPRQRPLACSSCPGPARPRMRTRLLCWQRPQLPGVSTLKPHPVPCVWGPGWVVRATASNAAGGTADSHLQRLPPCPALPAAAPGSI